MEKKKKKRVWLSYQPWPVAMFGCTKVRKKRKRKRKKNGVI